MKVFESRTSIFSFENNSAILPFHLTQDIVALGRFWQIQTLMVVRHIRNHSSWKYGSESSCYCDPVLSASIRTFSRVGRKSRKCFLRYLVIYLHHFFFSRFCIEKIAKWPKNCIFCILVKLLLKSFGRLTRVPFTWRRHAQ